MILPTDVIRLALNVLRERKLRAILTIIGIAIGPAAMVSIIGTVEGYSQVITEQLSSLGQNTIVILSTERYTVTDNDVMYVKGLKGVYDASPFYLAQATFRRSDGKLIKVTLYATDLKFVFKAIGSLKVKDGIIPPSGAYSAGMVGYDIVYNEKGRQLIRLGQAITVSVPIPQDSEIKVKSRTIKVSCILEKYGSALVVNPDTTIFLPKAAGPALLGADKYSGILIAVKDPTYVSSLTELLRRRYEGLAEVISFQQIADAIGSVIKTLDFLLYSLSSAAFMVAITGIMATMFTSVVERTREIGVLKAIGFSSIEVLVTILSEGFIMSLIGGVIGIATGTIGAYLLSAKSFKIGQTITIVASPSITPTLIGETVSLAILIGILGGLIPAYRASKIPPVEALRYE